MNQQDVAKKHQQLDLSYKDYLRFQKNLSNTKIDKYYILQKIGQGAFAQIYKGIDDQSKKEVAIKVLNIRNIQTQKNPRVKRIRKRLVQEESKIMMKFNSPYILKCYQCFENRDLKIMIIEYCNQGSLQDRIDTLSKIPQNQAISMLKQIVNGIGQCHKQKIIHRDLKADNILIHNGECKIADFGFSKALQISNENQLSINTILGTMTTMAPEVMKRQPYGLKADIWSIGVIFFQMIFGECPFKSDNSHELVAQIMNSNLLKMEQYRGVIPSKKVKKFLRQVLVVDVQKRLGWKQLFDHQLFEYENQSLPDDFHRKVQIRQADEQLLQLERQFQKTQSKIPSTLSESKPQNLHNQSFEVNEQTNCQYEVMDIYQKNMKKNKQFEQIDAQQIQKKQSFKQERKIQSNQQFSPNKQQDKQQDKQQIPKAVLNSKFRKVAPSQMKKVAQQVNKDQQQIFKWAKKIHIECLKTQCIFNNIIKIIQNYQLLDIKNRQIIQMMYLICTRCLNNISPITQQYQKRKESHVIKELNDQVSKLYKQVIDKWAHYSQLLTKKQNQLNSIAGDWFKKKLFSKGQMKIKDRFLTGIQSMVEFRTQAAEQKKIIQDKSNEIKRQDDLLDYSKEEQIDFTYKYIENNIKNLKICQQAKQIRNHMKHYKDICEIQSQDLKGKPFKEYLKLLLM